MAYITVKIPPGVVHGASPYETPNSWWDVNFIRWDEGVMQPIGGWERITPTALSGKVRSIFVWKANNNLEYILIGQDDKLNALSDGTVTNVSPANFIPLDTAGSRGYGTLDYGDYSYPAVNISSISRTSNVVTVTTATAHSFETGDEIVVANCATTSFNNTFANITVTSTTSFTYSQTGTNQSASSGDVALANLYGTPRLRTSTVWSKAVGTWSFTNWGEDVLATASTDGRLLYYDVTYPTTAAQQVGLRSIASVARSGNTSTITTAVAHDFTAGRTIEVTGTTVDGGSFNGTFTITATPTALTFTYTQTGSSNVTTTSDTGTAELTNVLTLANGLLSTPERHVLAIGADGYQRRIAWCSREDFTDWNYSSITNTAGYVDVESSSPLRAIVQVREGALVFSDTEVFLVRYIGLPFIYSVEFLGETKLVAPLATATFEGKCVWISETGFRLYDGGQILNVPCPVFNWVVEDINWSVAALRSFASWNGAFSEIWFFHPSTDSSECDRYVIWNYSEKWWSIGRLNRTAMAPARDRLLPIMAGDDNYLYNHETGWLGDSSSRIGEIWAESGAIGLNQPSGQGVEVKQIMPANTDAPSSMTFYFYGRQTPEGDERTFGPYSVRSDGYSDVRVSAKAVRMRVEANVDDYWTFGLLEADVAAGPRR